MYNLRTHGCLKQSNERQSLVEKKANYFASYFEFVTNQVGIFDNLIIDNHHSIVSKVLFQLTSNKENCIEYLDDYFDNPLINDNFLNQYNSWGNIATFINSYKQTRKKGKKIDFIKSQAELISDFKDLELELANTAFDNYLRSIISFLLCDHDIDEHKADLKLFTRFLISEFLFRGYDKSELRKVFAKILSRDIARFPFPKEIKKKSDKHKFISSRTFRQQFEGIKNIIDRVPDFQYFFFRVYNISTESNTAFQYNQVKFWNKEHPFVKKLEALSKKDTLLLGLNP